MRKVKQIVKQNGILTDSNHRRTIELCLKNGVPGATRTLDPLLRRQPLYPTELQGQVANYSNLT